MKKKTFLIGTVIFYMLFGFLLLALPFVNENFKDGMTSFFCLISATLCFTVVYVVGNSIES